MDSSAEYKQMCSDAKANRDAAGEGNVYTLKGLNLEAPLGSNISYATHKTSDIIGLLKEMERHDPDFTSPYSRVSKRLLDKVKSGEIVDQASILYSLGFVSKEGSDVFQQTVIYQEGNPLVETFNIGYQEGCFLQRANSSYVIFDLWNKNGKEIMPRVDFNKISIDDLDGYESDFKRMVIRNISGLYAVLRIYEPEIAFDIINKGSGTKAFYYALSMLGVKGEFTDYETDDIKELRSKVEGRYFEIPLDED